MLANKYSISSIKISRPVANLQNSSTVQIIFNVPLINNKSSLLQLTQIRISTLQECYICVVLTNCLRFKTDKIDTQSHILM